MGAVAGLFALMTEQHGVASCRQARRAGVSLSVERRLLREGAVVELLPGVLAAGGVRPGYAALAMAASLRPGVVAVSHGTAARLHGLAGFERYDRLDVLGRKGCRLRLVPPVITHYSRGETSGHVVRVGSIPVTSLALTLTLLAPACGAEALALALGAALAKGVTRDEIRGVAAAWQEHGRPGPGTLLSLLDRYPPISSSAADQGSISPATTAAVRAAQRS